MPHMLHVELHEIFECAHLKFMVSGRSKQVSKQASKHRYTHVRNAVTLVWGLLRLAPISMTDHNWKKLKFQVSVAMGMTIN